MFCVQSLFSHYKKGVHKDQLTDYPRDSLKPLILITFYPMPLHLRILKFFQVERIWYFLLKSAFIALFLCIVCAFSTPNKHNFIFIFIHIIYSQCSMAIELYNVQSPLAWKNCTLNDIYGVLQLYDPVQGLQHNACFFL